MTGDTKKTRARLGLDVDGEEVSIICADDDQMNQIARTWVKGDQVTLMADPRPPFGSGRGAVVSWFAPGAMASGGNEWH